MARAALDKIIAVDQSPIGRTPRSNPATYTGLFDVIRDMFSKRRRPARAVKPGRFSFNVKGGRCEVCKGDGQIKIEMHFLPDVYVPCEQCGGKRYNRETLEVRFKGKRSPTCSTCRIEEAVKFFEHIPKVRRRLETLDAVGLGYVRLGQPATTLSGGEAQRVKLATELSKVATVTPYILDEPTTGLHFADVQRLLEVLQRLVDAGNSVVVIEHNLDVIKCADRLIDMGPEGGEEGGLVVAAGTPEEVAAEPVAYGAVPRAAAGGGRHLAEWQAARRQGAGGSQTQTAGDGRGLRAPLEPRSPWVAAGPWRPSGTAVSPFNRPSRRSSRASWCRWRQQPPEGFGRLVVQVDPADDVDARPAARDPQAGGDPFRLHRRVDVEVELIVDRRGDRPLGDEQPRVAVARPAQIAVHGGARIGRSEKSIHCSAAGGLARLGSLKENGLCPYMSSRGGLPSGRRMFSIDCSVEMSPVVKVYLEIHDVGGADALQGAVGRVEDAGVQVWRALLRRVQAGKARRGRQRLEVVRAGGLPPDHPHVHRRVAPGGSDREVGVVLGAPGRPVPWFAAVGPFRRADDLQRDLDVVVRGFAHRAGHLRGPHVGPVVGVEGVAGAARSGRVPVQVVLVDPHAEVAVGGEQRDPVVDRGAPHRLQRRVLRSRWQCGGARPGLTSRKMGVSTRHRSTA